MNDKYIIEDGQLYVKVPAVERMCDLQRNITEINQEHFKTLGPVNDKLTDLLKKMGEVYGEKTIREIVMEQRAAALKAEDKGETEE